MSIHISKRCVKLSRQLGSTVIFRLFSSSNDSRGADCSYRPYCSENVDIHTALGGSVFDVNTVAIPIRTEVQRYVR